MSGWKDLEKYYRIVSPNDLLSGYEIRDLSSKIVSTVDVQLLSNIVKILIDTNDSGSFSIENVSMITLKKSN
jgi:hypothetical protein